MLENTVYKIRRKSDGLFSTGGSWPRWSRTGKTWSSIGNLKLHFSLFKRRKVPPYSDNNHEVVSFVIATSENTSTRISDYLHKEPKNEET